MNTAAFVVEQERSTSTSLSPARWGGGQFRRHVRRTSAGVCIKRLNGAVVWAHVHVRKVRGRGDRCERERVRRSVRIAQCAVTSAGTAGPISPRSTPVGCLHQE